MEPDDSELVQCTDFSQLFTTIVENDNGVLQINGNHIHLVDGAHAIQLPEKPEIWRSYAQVLSAASISLNSNWEFLADATIDNFGYSCCNNISFIVDD